jgi:hypothetical protein
LTVSEGKKYILANTLLGQEKAESASGRKTVVHTAVQYSGTKVNNKQ